MQYLWYKDNISREKIDEINWCQWWKSNLKILWVCYFLTYQIMFFLYFSLLFLESFNFCHQFPFFLYFNFNKLKKIMSKLGWGIPRWQFQTNIFGGMALIVVISLFDITRTYDITPGICFLDEEPSFPELSCSSIPDLWI